MDPATKSSFIFLEDWRKIILADSVKEAHDEENWPTKLLKKEGRTAIWNICTTLGVHLQGVPGLACRLLERYMRIKIKSCEQPSDSPYWQHLVRRFPIVMASCVQLAAKMNRVVVQINHKVVRAYFMCKGVTYSIADFIESEFNVYSTLDFSIPLWTSVDVGQMLAMEVGMPLSMAGGVAAVIDMVDYNLIIVREKLRWAADAAHLSERAVPLSLHVIAGAVAAGARHLDFGGPAPAARLAPLTRAPLSYIECVADVIHTYVLLNTSTHFPSPVAKKRAHNTTCQC